MVGEVQRVETESKEASPGVTSRQIVMGTHTVRGKRLGPRTKVPNTIHSVLHCEFRQRFTAHELSPIPQNPTPVQSVLFLQGP
jgi:hypothetical protein